MLTDRQIQAALKSPKPEIILNDGSAGRGTGSLRLVVRNGNASWFAFWKQDGRRQKKQLGKYPDLGLREARDRYANEIRSTLQEGKNPKALAVKTDQPTVEALFASYIASLRNDGKISAYQIKQALLLGKYNAADALGRRREAHQVEPGDVSAYLAKIYHRGSRVAADRTRTYMSAAFNWAIKSTHDYTAENRQDWGIKFNPVALVKKDTGASQPRERNLSADEIKAVWHGIDASRMSLETKSAIRLVLCCGQRVMETLRVEGREIDFKEKVWNMPAAKTKGRKYPHSLPLPDLAIDILRELVAVHGDGLLFPSHFGSQSTLGVASLGRAVFRWCEANDFEPFQPRDLRRTWKSRTGDAGIERFYRDLIQQHAKGDTGSKFYDRATYMPQLRAAMTTWNDWLIKAL